MFEKITKGEIHLPHLAKDDCSCNCGFLFAGEGGDLVATIHKQGDDDGQAYPPIEEAKSNAEFIAYCFNLQQKYDIGCLESIIDGLDLISGIHSESMSSQLARQLLTKIKK